MYAGQTASYNGYQYCLFPLDYLYCTQVSGPDSLSHCCGHPADWIGQTANYPYYAPCDCHRIQFVASAGQSTYVSDNPVWTPSGLHYVTFTVGHDNTPPSQTSFRQGDLLGHTGTAGYVTGDHVHIDQSIYQDDYIVSYGITCAGGNLCYAQEHSAYPYDVFYLGGTETVVQTQGMTFQTIPSTPQPPTPPGPVVPVGELTPSILMLLLKKRRKKLHGKRVTSSV